MKVMLILGVLFFGIASSEATAQVVKDPLGDYYQRNFGKIDLAGHPNPMSISPRVTPQTEVYYLEANFTGSGRKSVFITDEEAYLGGHGKYAWSVYCPTGSGEYQLVTDETHIIPARVNGPHYIGYIDEIKGYGAILGEKNSITAYYLENGTIQSKAIDQESEHDNSEYYPKYFHDKHVDHHVTIYTLAQLSKRYGRQ